MNTVLYILQQRSIYETLLQQDYMFILFVQGDMIIIVITYRVLETIEDYK